MDRKYSSILSVPVIMERIKTRKEFTWKCIFMRIVPPHSSSYTTKNNRESMFRLGEIFNFLIFNFFYFCVYTVW